MHHHPPSQNQNGDSTQNIPHHHIVADTTSPLDTNNNTPEHTPQQHDAQTDTRDADNDTKSADDPHVSERDNGDGDGDGDGDVAGVGADADADADADAGANDNVDDDDDDDDDPFAGLDDVASMDLYELSNYTFGKKNTESKARMWTDLPRAQHRKHLEDNYKQSGLRRSVAAVMLVHSENFPHLLLLQRSDGKGEYALPGGRLRPGETDSSGLQRKLMSKLMQEAQLHHDDDSSLDIGEKCTIILLFLSLKVFQSNALFSTCCVCKHPQTVISSSIYFLIHPIFHVLTVSFMCVRVCVRVLHFSTVATFYDLDFTRNYFPYIPRHLTSAREQLNVYHVSLPRTFAFAVPKNLQLVAVPIMEMYNDPQTYGNVIAAIPALLSRYHINLC